MRRSEFTKRSKKRGEKMSNDKPKFAIIGGIPFRGYTMTYLGLKVVKVTSNKAETTDTINKYWDECGGLVIVIDLETGEEVS